MHTQPPQPPRFSTWLLERLLTVEDGWAVLGDLEEEFYERASAYGIAPARRWYRWQAFKSSPLFLSQILYWGVIMLKSYLHVALRNLTKHKGYSFINVAGLAIGIACFTLILLYVQDELRYDRFHTHADRIYRVVEIIEGSEESASQPIPVGETLEDQFPHLVERAVRFFNFQAPTLTVEYQVPDSEVRRFNEERFFFTDSTVFEVFDFPMVRGNPTTALAEPNTVVLTESAVQRFFGTADPMGKMLRFEGEHDLTVTGILADVPTNAHFQFDFLASFESLKTIYPNPEQQLTSWYWNPAWTYVLLDENTQPETLEAQFPGFVEQFFPDVIKSDVRLYLQPLTDIHLHSKLDYEIRPNSDIAYIYIFSAIALFILLIACINFMNLSTARSAKRAREVGMRKVLGAYRGQLVRQFLGESVLISTLAVLVALPTVWALLPVLNTFAGKALVLNLGQNPLLLATLIAVPLVVGTLSGLYPALFLSGYKPVLVLKGSIKMARLDAGLLLRKGLVVSQFAISIILMVGTFIIYTQLRYLQNANLGFEEEAVVMISTMRSPMIPQYEAFKDELLEHPRIVSMTIAEDAMGAKYQTGSWVVEGDTEPQQLNRLFVHDDFATTFGIPLAAGREYSEAFPSDNNEAVIVNRAFVEQQGWESPEAALGRKLGDRAIIGVTEDFHFASLHQPITPFVLPRIPNVPRVRTFFGRYFAVRVNPTDLPTTLAFMESAWQARVPDRPFDYFFLDDNLDALYRSETTLQQVASAFALLAILVACLGLFGLASFTAEQRTKEIGIRKVLGAPLGQLVAMLSKEFVILVGLATLIAWPIAYFALNSWLSNFAYQVNVSFLPFVVAGVLALVIATLTVSYQAVKAALTDPVKALRYE